MKRVQRLAVVALVFSAACVQPPANGSQPDDTAPPGGGQQSTQESDRAAIVALENQAKAIAKTTGCGGVSQCRTAPVGNRACGGPRYYIAYCAQSTDSVALFRKLDQVAAAERAYNEKYGIASTCEFRMPPPLTFSGGECRAAGQ